jgi:hypothetical protein
MRAPASIAALAICAAAVLALALLPQPAAAEEIKPAEPGPCMCPDAGKAPSLGVRPKYADNRATLDENDEIAALEAVRVALSEVGDGSTYVWHRMHGRLSGLVQPTASFKDPAGRVCRHILLIMTTGGYSAKAEGIACRLADGRWQLDG